MEGQWINVFWSAIFIDKWEKENNQQESSKIWIYKIFLHFWNTDYLDVTNTIEK